jgi:catechol 2,3-dioxygenase-like lactoylglutathione lyase family enzyme
MQFDHFGIFVTDIWDAYARLTAHVPIKTRSFTINDNVWGATILLAYGMGDVVYELIEPVPGGAMEKVAAASAGKINHVAYRVSSLAASLAMAKDNGGEVLAGPLPAFISGGNYMAAFVLTKLGIIMEFIEETAAKKAAA